MNKAAGASINQFCGTGSGCGTPDVHPGAGLLLCMSVAIVALVCSLIGLVLVAARRLNRREELAFRLP